MKHVTTSFVSIIGIYLVLAIGCTCSQSKCAEVQCYESDDIIQDTPTLDDNSDNSILERAKQAFYKIPDHAKVSEEARPYMTEDLFNALSAAWDVPCWLDGEIGDEEFLGYFVTGNGGSTVGEAVYVGVKSVQSGRYNLELKYTEMWGDVPDDKLTTISLVMVKENGEWRLDDFGNGIKDQCVNYIRKQVGDYISGRMIQYMQENQRADWYTDEHIANVQDAFKKYIDENAVYLR